MCVNCSASLVRTQGFLSAGGVRVLVTLMWARLLREPFGPVEELVVNELLSCLKAVMNTEDFLRTALEVPGAVDSIALCVDDRMPSQICCVALEILSVTCFFSGHGHRLVLSALEHQRQRALEQPFAPLIKLLQRGTLTTKLAVLKFVNTMVTRTDKIADRVALRNHFLAGGIVALCRETLDAPPPGSAKAASARRLSGGADGDGADDGAENDDDDGEMTASSGRNDLGAAVLRSDDHLSKVRRVTTHFNQGRTEWRGTRASLVASLSQR